MRTSDRSPAKWILWPICALLLGCGPSPVHSTSAAVIELSATQQTIDGFGASATGYTTGLSDRQIDQFFDPDHGLGLSILRVRAIAGNVQEDCDCVANDSRAHCVRNSFSQIVSGDLAAAQKASALGAHVVVSPWSPPAEMKSSGKYCTSGAMIGSPEHYQKYAAQLVSLLTLLKQNGVSAEAISIQNEPDVENKDYDTCTWTAKQIHDFIPVLYQAIQSAGLANVRIAAPEQSNWSFELMADSIADPNVADKIGIVFGHAYSPEHPTEIPRVMPRHVWQTEAGAWTRFDGSMKDAIYWAQSIHNYLVIGANAWLYWNLDCSKPGFNHDNNMCLTNSGGKLAKRAFVLGQYAKFVRPGWQRVGVTYSGPLLITAFKGPQNEVAIIAINPGKAAITDQMFSMPGGSARRLTVTPWMTSASASLEAQPAPATHPGVTSFSYTIPASSVVTFQVKSE